MAFNGTGTFVRIYNWVTDKTNSVPITASRMDDETDGIATGLSNCITKDGQTTVTANIPMNSKKFTGLAVGSARTDSINVGQVQDGQFTDLGLLGGSADAYTASLSPAITAYTSTMRYTAKIPTPNLTTTPYLQLNSIGTPASDAVIKKLSNSGAEISLEIGDLVGVHDFKRNVGSSCWLVLNPNKPSVDTTNLITLPTFQQITSGSGTYNKNYTFIITSGSATVGATYTNNGITFTVSATVASAIKVVMSGSGAPTASGTLTKASGTGDSTLTFTRVLSPNYIRIRAVGGGGGGSGSGTTTTGGSGGNGGNTTFGTSLITCAGGVGATSSGGGGAGGTATINSPGIGTAFQGSYGSSSGSQSSSAAVYGASGGSSFFGGNGACNVSTGSGIAAIANTGSGGGGGGMGAATNARNGFGGGAGGFVDAIIVNPSDTYSYAVGAAGAAGSAGTSGSVGGAGGSGYIEITEYYQ
jgi:hypothetical protein